MKTILMTVGILLLINLEEQLSAAIGELTERLGKLF